MVRETAKYRAILPPCVQQGKHSWTRGFAKVAQSQTRLKRLSSSSSPFLPKHQSGFFFGGGDDVAGGSGL